MSRLNSTKKVHKQIGRFRTNLQIIEYGGHPVFVLVPYDEYLELSGKADDQMTIPQEVSKIATLEGKSLIRAWREYLDLTQEQVATKAGVSRAAYSQMEAKGARPRRATLGKIAHALGIRVEQLEE